MGGLIASARQLTTKKGDEMAFLTLEDLEGSTDVVVFPDTFSKCGELIEEGGMVWIRGIVKPGRTRNTESSDEDEQQQDVRQLQAEEILSLETVPDKLTSAVEIKLDATQLSKENLDTLKNICGRYPGECDLVIRLQKEDQVIFVLASREFKIEPSDAFVQDLSKIVEDATIITSNRTARVQTRSQRSAFV